MEAGYREHAPAAALRPWVECFWTSELPDPVSEHVVLPDGCIDILFSSERGMTVVGAMTARQTFLNAPGETLAGVRFHPGAAVALLGIEADAITDGTPPLEDLWGSRARALWNRVGEARTAADAASALASGLPALVDPPARWVQAMLAAKGDIDLDRIAMEANLSPRQFRRHCLARTGLSPKYLCRVLRFRRAMELLRSGRLGRDATVAAECGYYDQAHMIRDFREIAGRTPGSFSSAG